ATTPMVKNARTSPVRSTLIENSSNWNVPVMKAPLMLVPATYYMVHRRGRSMPSSWTSAPLVRCGPSVEYPVVRRDRFDATRNTQGQQWASRKWADGSGPGATGVAHHD